MVARGGEAVQVIGASDDDSVPPPRRRLLDVVARAGVQILTAHSVTVALGRPGHWRVQASCGGAEGPAPGWLVTAADGLPSGAVPVTRRLHRGDVLELAVLAGPEAGEGGSYAATGMVGPGDRSQVLVLADVPRRPPAEVAAGLQDLLDAAGEAVSAELDGHRRRSQAVLAEREEERRRWARELHDETLQQLGALQVLLTTARRTAPEAAAGPESVVVAAVDQATELVSAQIANLRHLITELRPAALDELGLRAPLQALAERTEALTGLRVDTRLSLRYADGEVATRLLPDIELAVYRVVQEALTNAGRHSKARRAQVVVQERDGQVCVEVSDDGVGLNRARVSAGFGIVGMQERAALAGGHLEVLPANPDQPGPSGPGTLVRLVVPAVHRSADGPAGGYQRPDG